MKWNDRLRQAFEAAKTERGITQTELGNYCGVSPPSVTTWLNGETKNIEAQYLLPACQFLKVSPMWVIFGEGNPIAAEENLLPDSIDVPALEIIKLISLYGKSTTDGRSFIISAAESAEKN